MSKGATVKRTLLMSVAEVATALQVSEETVYALVATGTWLGSQKVGHTYIIPRRAFDRLYLDGDVRELATEPTNPFLFRRASSG